MRVVQIRTGRVVRLALFSCFTLILLALIYSHFNLQPELSREEFMKLKKDGSNQPKAARYEAHKSYPDEKPVFLGTGNLGNYEKMEENIVRPRNGPGEAGKSHRLKPSQKVEEEQLKNVYGFNQLVSDEISLNRSIPDIREKECAFWDYPTQLPSASVILVLHNEGWSTLFRTINSVINRSPPQFLKEVVLVDDKSELEHLHERLDAEILKPYYKGKVVVVRNKEREGLIRSRNNGALAAKGDVVIFLDAHCEVNKNWLPPLLAPIHENRRTLSVPVIDGINWNDFSINSVYAEGSHSRGLFEWGMLYKEGNLPSKEAARRRYHSEPYNSPTHAGGLFAIDREWFKELGWYDPGLYIWGGENFELSFKTWMCGGRSVWVPCSRVAHVYRGHSCSSCHSGSLANKFGGQPTTMRNYKRVIETWFDPEYKEFFYTREPMARFVDMGDISDQLALKKKLNCKSFDWFMKEVAYDVFDKYPKLPPNAKWGELKNIATNLCLDTRGQQPPEKTVVSGCHGMGGNQMFRLNTKGQLTSGEWCQVADTSGSISIQWCPFGSVSGPWEYKEDLKQIYNKVVKMCLAVLPDTKSPVMRSCDKNNAYQKWNINTLKPYWSS